MNGRGEVSFAVQVRLPVFFQNGAVLRPFAAHVKPELIGIGSERRLLVRRKRATDFDSRRVEQNGVPQVAAVFRLRTAFGRKSIAQFVGEAVRRLVKESFESAELRK